MADWSSNIDLSEKATFEPELVPYKGRVNHILVPRRIYTSSDTILDVRILFIPQYLTINNSELSFLLREMLLEMMHSLNSFFSKGKRPCNLKFLRTTSIVTRKHYLACNRW